jgi:hypothetical protein
MLVGGSTETCEAKENPKSEIGSSNPRFIESELEMKYGETKGSFAYYYIYYHESILSQVQ